MLSELYRNKLKNLAGIVKEDVTLVATDGRSDEKTLSWYAEEYLLSLSSDVINELDKAVKSEPSLTLSISRGASKMVSNTLVTKLIINGNANGKTIDDEFILTLSVNLEQNANTTASITTKGITNHLNLNSKHSAEDLNKFRAEISEYILNSIKIKSKTN